MPFRIFLLSLIFLFIDNLYIYSQIKAINRSAYRIHIFQTSEAIDVNGILDEEVWQTAEKTMKFQRVTPTDTGFAIAQTEVMLSYDKNNIYLGAICYDPTYGKRPVESLRRDFSFGLNDNFMFFLDTYNNQNNGFAFGVTTAGSQCDGIMNSGTVVDYSWDIKWKSAVKNYDDKWVVECAVPFRSLRYLKGDKEWGINFGRLDLKNNEKSAWAPMPRQFPHCSLPYTGTLVWDRAPEKAGLRFSLIPYASGRIIKNKENGEDIRWKANTGFDAKVILSTSMNLDITVNPDYSQVEVDQQQTNLDRFELFFPEKRQFFLENSDLFANLGNNGIQPFFSRRIGLNVPVNQGLRLTGRIGNNWRMGLMNIQTGTKIAIPSSNYGVAVLQRELFSRSSLVGFIVNKQVTGNLNDSVYSGYRYNRVAGLEYNIANSDNRWTGKVFYHQSLYPGASANASTFAANLTYASPYLKLSLDEAWVGSDYIAEAGYVRRTGYYEISPEINYLFFPPAQKKLINHGPGIKSKIIFDPAFDFTDRQTQLFYSISWQNKNLLTLSLNEEYVKLLQPYDPTNSGDIKLNAGDEFSWKEAIINFSSDTRKLLYYSAISSYGSYFNGKRLNISGTINYRIQPYASFAIAANYNNIKLPQPYHSAKLILLGPKLDITFTNNIFLTTFIQYNNQIDNININTHFQWRFAPVSDLFIVYTGNSYTTDFRNKDQGLVVKLSYWFN